MDNNTFGINNNILEKALKNGIKVKKDNNFININGFISLTYIQQFNKFILAFGSNSLDASWVFVDNYEKDWILKDYA